MAFLNVFRGIKDVIDSAPIQILVQSMKPSYIPVCYGSMFTEGEPEEHGIDRYMKPVFKVETLFDKAPESERHLL